MYAPPPAVTDHRVRASRYREGVWYATCYCGQTARGNTREAALNNIAKWKDHEHAKVPV